MKKTARLRFFIGILLVVLTVGVLFVYLDFTMSRVDSRVAQLQSDTFTVGVDYSGIIDKQYVDDGDQIKKGDPLFAIKSSTLAKAIENNETAKSDLLYSLNDDGDVLLSAAADGKIQSLHYRAGAFVPANSEIATVDIDKSLYVSATYALSSPDYSRVSRKSRVDVRLPNGQKIDATVYDVSLQKVDGEILTTVKARLNKDIDTTVFTVGTPVDTTLYLNNDTWYHRITNVLDPLFKPQTSKR